MLLMLELCGAGCSACQRATAFRGFSASSVETRLFFSSLFSASGQCYTFGSNQHGQLGTNSGRNSRVPHLVVRLQAMKVTVVACGDAFTVAIGAGKAEAPVSWVAAGSGFPLPVIHAVAKADPGDSPEWHWGARRYFLVSSVCSKMCICFCRWRGVHVGERSQGTPGQEGRGNGNPKAGAAGGDASIPGDLCSLLPREHTAGSKA